MKLYLVVHDDGQGIQPFFRIVSNNRLDLYIGNLTQYVSCDKLCLTQMGTPVYLVHLCLLPEGMEALQINNEKNDYSCLTANAFWALKVFALKCKFTSISQIALQQHGSEQQNNWLKVIGIMEPILKGGWF